MNIEKINVILGELTSQSRGIQGAVLVTAQGQPLTAAFGIEHESTQIMAELFLYLAQETCQEFNGQQIESITVRGQEGYVIFTSCHDEVFLLVKASQAFTPGFVEREVNLIKETLRSELPLSTISNLKAFPDSALKGLPDSNAKTSPLQFPRNSRAIKKHPIRYSGLPLI